jgi:hypothetical protein
VQGGSDPATPAADCPEGQTLKRYRQAGSPRQHLVPDLVIAAHPQKQAGRLPALDRGYLKKGFLRLQLLAPGAWDATTIANSYPKFPSNLLSVTVNYPVICLFKPDTI